MPTERSDGAKRHQVGCVAPAPFRPRVVVLYTNVVHYVVGVLRALRAAADCDIDVVYWDGKGANDSRYEIEPIPGVRFHPRSSLNDAGLAKLLSERTPDIVWISGWQDAGYLRALQHTRSAGLRTRVVCGIDDQWHGTLRQRLGQVYFRLFYRKIFDFMWVAGKPQYHYAQRFGYGPETIVTNLLSADTSRFAGRCRPMRRFIFVGRFAPVKGLDTLLDAYSSLPDDTRAAWPLVLIGDGTLRAMVEMRKTPTIDVLPFLQADELIRELEIGGVGCVPSTVEPWGVVVHEMALMGYPLILSSACGSASEFLIAGHNGYLFHAGDAADLRDKMLKVTRLTDRELDEFSARSHSLGKRISSEQAAASLLCVLHLRP